MFEYIEKCKKFEKLSTFERFALLANKSLIITNKLSELGLNVNDSLSLIATFILGSIVSDGEVNEKEFLLIYPALLRTFGDNFDFDSIKEAFQNDFKTRNELKNYLLNQGYLKEQFSYLLEKYDNLEIVENKEYLKKTIFRHCMQ